MYSLSVGHQLLQLSGAMMILAAFISHQFKWIDPDGALYNILNGVGSAILGYYALWPRFQAGFVTLEIAWTGVSMYGLWRAARRERETV